MECVGEISRRVVADWFLLLAVSSIDYQDHEFPSLCAAWEERGRCHITLQQQDNSQSGSRLYLNRVVSFGFNFVWLSEDTGLSTSYSNFLILAERYSYLNLNVTVII